MRQFFSLKRLITVFSILSAVLTVFSFIGNTALSKKINAAYANTATIISATKIGALDTTAGGDLNGNGAVNPGDRLRYSVVISNAGTDATGVNLSDTLDANTTFTPGSIIASPVAVNESYSAVGNVSITVSAASGVLVNDLNANTGAACSVGNTCTITTAGTFLSANGGNVTLNADGSFTFNPKVGFEGADTFTYTLANGTGLTDTGTVTINVAGMIWFVNNNAGACSSNCDGRLSNPFTTLAAFNTANALTGGLNPDTSDNIFVFESATQYTGAVTLRSGQKLIGQDSTASLQTIAGIASIPIFSQAFPVMSSGNATITNIGSTVTLNTNATLRGFSINSIGATGINDPASAITGVTVSEVSVSTTNGTAILLSDAGGGFTFPKISTSGGTNGISLTNTTGSFSVTGDGASDTANTTRGRTTAKLGGGTIALGSGGTITATTGKGVQLTNSQNVVFRNMIVQNNGNATAGSGGDGINAANVTGLTLDNMLVTGQIGNFGLRGATVSNLSIVHSEIYNNATTSGVEATDIWNVRFNDLTGSGSVQHSKFATAREFAFGIYQNGTSTLNLVVSNSEFTDAVSGLSISAFDSSNVTFNVTGSSFLRDSANGIFYGGNDSSGGGQFTVQNSTFDQNTVDINIAHQGAGKTQKFYLNNNTIKQTFKTGSSNSVNVYLGGTSTAATVFEGIISNNRIGNAGVANSGSDLGRGIFVEAAGAGTVTTSVTGNIVRQIKQESAFYGQAAKGTSTAATSPRLNLTVTGNDFQVNTASGNALAGVELTAGTIPNIGDNPTLCANINSNTAFVGHPTFAGVYVVTSGFTGSGTSANPTVELQGYTGAANNLSQIETFLGSSARATTNTPAPILARTTGTVRAATAACATPNVSLAALNAPFEIFNRSLAENDDFAQITDEKQNLVMPQSDGAQELKTQDKTFTYYAADKTYEYAVSSIKYISKAFSSLEATLLPTVSAEEKSFQLSPLASGETLTKVLGNLPAGESITVQFKAIVNQTTANFYSVSNTANITADGNISINSTTATNTIVQPASISKAFGKSFIATNETTTLTYTITNGNAAALSGLSFSDALPAGLTINTPNGLNNSCGGTVTATQRTSSISLSGGTVGANTNCTIKVDVKGTPEGAKTSTTSNIGSTNGGIGNTASATLNVINPPTFTKAFTTSTVQLNDSTTLSFTITNASQTFPLNNVSFTDTLPIGLVVSTPSNLTGTCGGGTITANQGAGTISLSGAALAANANCTFAVNVTGTTAGEKNNSATLSTTELGSTPTATASVTVVAPPTIAKAFAPVSIQSGGTSTVTLTLSNPNATGALTNASFTDALTNMTASGGAAGGTCAGASSNTFAAGATNLSFSGITVPNSGSCAVTFNVTSSVPGVQPNTSSGVATVQTPIAGTPSNTANLTVIAPADLTVTKTHTGNFTQGDTSKTYTITVTNSGETATSGTVSVTDTLPSGLTATAISGNGWTCALDNLTCTRTDALAKAAGYPAIILTVNVASNAPASVTNTANVSGGGETDTSNNTANDSTTIDPAAKYTISGQITNGGEGLSGVSVALSGASAKSTVTDAAGNYSFADLITGNYTLTPSLNGYTFVEPTITVSNLSADQINRNFATSIVTFEGDVAARPTGDGAVDIFDLITVGNIIAKLPNVAPLATGGEFQRADAAPRATKGDGSVDVQDLIQIGLYAAASEALTPASGATAPIPPSNANAFEDVDAVNGSKIFNEMSAPEAGSAAISAGTVSSSGVSTAIIPIQLNSTNAAGVQFTITYDPAKLSIPSLASLTDGAANTSFTLNNSTPGHLGVVAVRSMAGAVFPAQTLLFNINFAVAPGATSGAAAIEFGNTPVPLKASDPAANGVTITTAPGAVTILGTTAASVSISGRALTNGGRGIGSVIITMIDSQGRERTVRTNSFGYYNFKDTTVGETYILTAKGKRYTFAQPSQVVNVNEDAGGINFIANRLMLTR